MILFNYDVGHHTRGAALVLQPGAASQLQKCFFSLSVWRRLISFSSLVVKLRPHMQVISVLSKV